MKKTKATKPGKPSIHIELSVEEKVEFEHNENLHKEKIKKLDIEKYKRDRAKAYPSIEEQLDMIHQDKLDGTNLWCELICKIKNDLPKGEKNE